MKEQLEKFGVPVLTDHSSYEKNPLGRTEWVKLYGLLTGHEKEAEEAFAAENEAFASIGEEEETGKTVAFFYITTNGEVNVRKSADYLPKMIELAGGKYIFDKLGDEDDVASTMSMQMEEFYAGAKDADYIIYNSTIDGSMQTLSDLTGKSPMLEKFKAVQNGNVYCTTKNLYQSTMELGTITSDIHKMQILLISINWSDTMKKRQGRYTAAFIILFALVLMFLVLNVCIGSVTIPISEIPKILSGNGADDVYTDIVMGIRFPRALAAAILGGGLALSGYLLQTFFHNPIAGPFTLGISSGAKLMVSLVMVASLGNALKLSSWLMIIAAFVGAMICMGFVILMSRVMDQMSMLIVSGVMIGYICSAITDFIVTFADDADIVNLHNWSKGSFSGITWNNVSIMAIVTGVTLVWIFLLSKPLSAYQMGESYARNMGLNVQMFRILLVLLSSVLSACVTAFAGPVSFVGIAVPHLVKNLFGTAKPILMIPACFLGGATFCLFCDLLARTMFAPTELSISTVTAVFGAPVVIYIMIHRKKEKAE